MVADPSGFTDLLCSAGVLFYHSLLSIPLLIPLVIVTDELSYTAEYQQYAQRLPRHSLIRLSWVCCSLAGSSPTGFRARCCSCSAWAFCSTTPSSCGKQLCLMTLLDAWFNDGTDRSQHRDQQPADHHEYDLPHHCDGSLSRISSVVRMSTPCCHCCARSRRPRQVGGFDRGRPLHLRRRHALAGLRHGRRAQPRRRSALRVTACLC